MQLAQDKGLAQTNSQECTPLRSGRLLMSRYKSKFDYIGKLKKSKTRIRRMIGTDEDGSSKADFGGDSAVD